jgi:hypothetical protein
LPTTKSQTVKLAIIFVLGMVMLALLVAGYGEAQSGSGNQAAQHREWLKGEGAFFVRKNCIECHSISAFGIKTATIGPDLSEAIVDTEKRFGKTLEEFLRSPNGTMNIVLATKIPLTDAEKQEAVRLLKIAHQKKLEQQAQLNK